MKLRTPSKKLTAKENLKILNIDYIAKRNNNIVLSNIQQQIKIVLQFYLLQLRRFATIPLGSLWPRIIHLTNRIKIQFHHPLHLYLLYTHMFVVPWLLDKIIFALTPRKLCCFNKLIGSETIPRKEPWPLSLKTRNYSKEITLLKYTWILKMEWSF